MSGSQNRYQVPPTVTVLTVMKARLIGATKGHALLKKKADALTVRYRQILKEIVEAKQASILARQGAEQRRRAGSGGGGRRPRGAREVGRAAAPPVGTVAAAGSGRALQGRQLHPCCSCCRLAAQPGH